MAQRLTLSAQPRSVLGKHVKRLRKQGIVPANIYGHGQSRPIQAAERALDLLLRQGGRGQLVDIAVDGETHTALFKTFVRHPRSGGVMHVDFQAVSLTERVQTSVPVVFEGEPPAARLGAVVLHSLTELKVEALAGNLPERITVDLSVLTELGSSIKVADLKPFVGVTLLDPPEEVVARADAPRVEVEIEPSVEEGAPAEAAAEEGSADAGGEGDQESKAEA